MENIINTEKTLVSIITVTYNSERTIERTILSVLNQTYFNIEYIIVDGKSQDKTIDIVRKYRSEFGNRLTIISEEDKGIYDAMNKGIAKARGEIIGIINSDDWYESNAVEKVVEALINNNNLEGVYFGYQRLVTDSEKEILISRSSETNLKNKMIEHSTCFVSKKIYNKQGLFDLRFKYSADYDLMLRLYEKNIPFIKVDNLISNFTVGGASSTSSAALETIKLKKDRGIISQKQYFLKSFQMKITSSLKRIFSYS